MESYFLKEAYSKSTQFGCLQCKVRFTGNKTPISFIQGIARCQRQEDPVQWVEKPAEVWGEGEKCPVGGGLVSVGEWRDLHSFVKNFKILSHGQADVRAVITSMAQDKSWLLKR